MSQSQSQSQLERERILNQERINSSLNSSQIHDYGFAERKRYGKLNNSSDIFNIKGQENNITAATGANKRRYQHHHYQLTSPFGRDDITVDNPHKVQSFYSVNEAPMPSSTMTEGMMPQTESNYGVNSEMTTMEGRRSRDGRSRRGMPPTSAASNGIERQEDIFVSREDLQTPEQRKEALLKRQKLDQLLNSEQPSNEPLPPSSTTQQQQNQKFAAPFATSFDLNNKNNNGNNNHSMPSSAGRQNSSISVSGLAPFATIEYNPYEKYASQHHSAPSTAQVQEYNQQVHPGLRADYNLNLDPNLIHEHEHDHEHTHPHPHSHDYPSHEPNMNEPMYNHEPSMEMPSSQPIIQTPYFHETSSRHLPREEDVMSNAGASSSNWKGKEREMEMGMDPSGPSPSAPQPIPHSKPRGGEDIDPESGAPLSKDHITSSFDKATALSDRNYFNKIMNDHHRPEESPEEILNKEKYEQAKSRFDELYRDLISTEDLKNHPELIEELNRISGTSNYPNPKENESSLAPTQDIMSRSGASPTMAPPPPPSQMNYDQHSSYAPKEDIYNSLEDLDKKLEKISFDANQTTASYPNPNSDSISNNNRGVPEVSSTLPRNNQTQTSVPGPAQTQAPTQATDLPHSTSSASVMDSSECHCNCNGTHHSTRLNRKNYNESHIFDTPEVTQAPPPQDPKTRGKVSSSFTNIFGSTEIDPEAEKKAMENRQLYSRRHLKLAQQNHSDIFCLGGDTTTHEQKLMASELGQNQLPPEVPALTTVSRRSSQLNLQTSNDNPMLTTYGSMNNSVSSMDRRQMAEQPTYGLSSKQSHHTYKTKSRKYTPAQSSQILF